ncbi:tRNA-adenosine deaminase [Nitzschia inconspicua]|uniref:tRNA-adenosine deaminase n=1 Tax=Nitzschia inconspicua TaxID=303405 RepID=A0A9K3PQ22_9STRA|nr:tRNA-adenosine deaminase [Nitzschia inconspicua]
MILLLPSLIRRSGGMAVLAIFTVSITIVHWIRFSIVASFSPHDGQKPPMHVASYQSQYKLRRHAFRNVPPPSFSSMPSSLPLNISGSVSVGERHTKFMQMALQQAKLAGEQDEVPIGAIIVQRRPDGSFHVLSQACNSMESTHDASAHAELLAMRKASQRIGNWRLLNSTLYSTLEPCPMCLAAAQAFRVEEIVYGAPDLRLGAVETYMRMLDDYNHPLHQINRVMSGVLKNESATMMKEFFKRRRTQAKRYPPPTMSVGSGFRSRWKNRMKNWLQKLLRRKRSP